MSEAEIIKNMLAGKNAKDQGDKSVADNELELLRWKVTQHKNTARTMGDVFTFFSEVFQNDCGDSTITLSGCGRDGLTFLMNQCAGIMYDAAMGEYHNFKFYGFTLEPPTQGNNAA